MDNNNWRAAQGQVQMPGQVMNGEAVAAAGMEGGDWRNQLQPDSRQRIVNKIMETLKRHLPFSGQEGLQELKKIAVRFEEKIYTAATSQSDYLRKISLKMLTMETKSQNPMAANSLQSNATSTSRNPQDPGNSFNQMHQEAMNCLQQMQQSMANMLPNHAQPPQSQPMQQKVDVTDSITGSATTAIRFAAESGYITRDMQQRIPASSPLLQQQSAIDQQKQLLQSERGAPEGSQSKIL